MLTISVRDFGPIREGSLALRPLTVLIGPNNAGKSYLATLLYALTRALGAPAMDPGRLPALSFAVEPKVRSQFSQSALIELRRQIGQRETLSFEDLPGEVKERLASVISEILEESAARASREIQRCFGSTTEQLRRETGSERFEVVLRQQRPEGQLTLTSCVDGLKWAAPHLDLSELQLTIEDLYHWSRDPDLPSELIFSLFLREVIRAIFPLLLTRAHYFPAARSGILQAHKALVSFMLSRLPLVGVAPREIPPLTGVVADFIANLLTLQPRQVAFPPSATAHFLESKLCHGTIDIGAAAQPWEYPEILYQAGSRKFELHQTSSLVSEVAPIVLLLKHNVRQGDLMVIEEPEAHLHPEGQRIMARALVKLVRTGVQLIITTHSDYLLHQLSNLVQLARVGDKAKQLGYGEDELLRAAEVTVALFHYAKGDDGSAIEELRVTEEEGIPQDEFVRIAEAIYDESVAIEVPGPQSV